MRSTGQTGPNTTVPFTPEPEALATVVGGGLVATGRSGWVVVVRAGRGPAEGSGEVDDGGGAVVVGGLPPSDRNAESWLPQPAPRRATVIPSAGSRSLRGRERTVPV